MDIYCFSGLGTDERVYHNLKVSHNLINIAWIPPHPKESMEEYAMRLSEKIDTSKPYALMGISFGGMIASVLAHRLKPVKTILISSAASAQELPLKMRLFHRFPVHQLPTRHYVPPTWIVAKFFGIKKGYFYTLLNDILRDTDPYLVKWSCYQIIKWKQRIVPKNILRIHSDNDRLIPLKRGIKYDHILKGGHFMAAERYKEIATIIEETLKS